MGITIANKVCDAIKDTEVSETLKVVGIDRSLPMTGAGNEFIRGLAERFEKPLQWIVCLLHCNELPHVFLELDGTKKP